MRRLANVTLSRLLLPPFILALVLAALPFTGSQKAYACPFVFTDQLVANSDLIFVGSVHAIDGDILRFDVERYFKGSGPFGVSVHWIKTDELSATFPGYWKQSGEAVLVFAYQESDGGYYTTSCSRNRPVDPEILGTADVEAITGPGVLPDDVTPRDAPAEPNVSTPWAVILPIAFAIPLAVLVVPALLRRRGGH